jgi:site-specific DNA-methyltransferase (adenine-specific)
MRKLKLQTNRIICGNNIEILKTFPNECIDLTITSPPYDNLRDYKGYTFDFETLAHELYRVTKTGGVVVWIVGDQVINKSESGTSFKQALYFKEECGFLLHDTMIYVRLPRYPERNRYAQSFEYMFILSKGVPKTFNPIIDRKNTYGGQKSHFGKHTVRGKDGNMKLMSSKSDDFIKKMGKRINLWYYSVGGTNTTKDKIAFEHPAIFPDELSEDHILSWSNKNDVILDPMNGSGTTTKMAYLNNRQYVGIEISKKYCNIAEERLKITSPKVYKETNKKQLLKRHINLLEC